MNITLNAFLEGCEKSAANLERLLLDWNSIGEDLQQEYLDQIRWMIDHRLEVHARARVERYPPDFFVRLDAAIEKVVQGRVQLMTPRGELE